MVIPINFYIHDPSTKNHFLPIIEQLSQNKKDKYQINLIDLRNYNNNTLSKSSQFSIEFYGLSTNQIELHHVGKGNLKVPGLGVPSKGVPNKGNLKVPGKGNLKVPVQNTLKILYIESLVGERLSGANSLPFDYIFVATKGAYNDLLSRFPNQPIILVGDTYYDYLNRINSQQSIVIRTNDNFHSNKKEYCTCFLSPDDIKMDQELTNFENFVEYLQALDHVLNPDQVIKIRFHPRSSQSLIKYIEDFVEKNSKENRYLIDLSEDTNYDIIKSSILTFSIGSTMGFESIILGVPSAFVNLGNKFTYPYDLYETDIIKVCTTIEELREFVNDPTKYINLEFISLHKSAIDRTIKEIDQIIVGIYG